MSLSSGLQGLSGGLQGLSGADVGGGLTPPAGTVFLVDSDGAYLLDSDGAYLIEAA